MRQSLIFFLILMLSVNSLAKFPKYGGPGINIGAQSSDPASGVKGDIYYNSTTNKFKYYNNSSWQEVGSGSGSGGINFVGLGSAFTVSDQSDRDAEINTGTWATFDDGAVSDPVDMTGGSSSTLTLSRTTTAGEVLNGLASLKLVKSAANGQGEGISTSFYIPVGYRGQNAQLTIPLKIISGSLTTDDLKVYAYDITNSVFLPLSGASITQTSLIIDNTVIGTTTAQVRLGLMFRTTSTTAVTFSIDDVTMGPPTNIGFANISTESGTAYNPTPTNFGTVTNNAIITKRNGDTLEGSGTFTIGTGTGSAAALALPTGISIDTTKEGAKGKIVGEWFLVQGSTTAIQASTGAAGFIFYDGSTSSSLYFAYQTTSSAYSKMNGNAFAATDISIKFKVRISEWKNPVTGYNPGQIANSWSGYHDNTCSWARTNTAYGDPATDGSCTLNDRVNNNFGTVTGSNNLPSITFTPSRVGSYWVCAFPKIAASSTGQTIDALLWDGTTNIAEWQVSQPVGTYFQTAHLCGLYKATSTAAKTLSIQTKVGSGSVTINAQSTNASSIEWSIIQLDQQLPAPVLVNGVVSNYSGVSNVVSMQTSINSTSSTIRTQSGSAFAYASTNAANDINFTIAAGTFSSAPICQATTQNEFDVSTLYLCELGSITSTTLRVFMRQGNTNGAANNAALFCNVTCIGPK